MKRNRFFLDSIQHLLLDNEDDIWQGVGMLFHRYCVYCVLRFVVKEVGIFVRVNLRKCATGALLKYQFL